MFLDVLTMSNLSLSPRCPRKMPSTWKELHEYFVSGFMHSWICKQNTKLSQVPQPLDSWNWSLVMPIPFLSSSCWPLSQGPLYMLRKHSATEPHPRSCLFDICHAMYPKLPSKWKLSCLSFPECWYVYTNMLNFIPRFDHIWGTCMSLLLHLPTVPKSKPSNDCILSFLKQIATS